MHESELLEGLREAARLAGIDLLGVTSAEPFELRDTWRSHDQPRDLLASARSVVVAGFRSWYPPRLVSSEPGRPRGRFTPGGSRVFDQMFRHCADVVERYLRERGYEAVDAGDIAMKPAVVRANLGRYGKHAVVITPEFGSMVMFAAVVTDAPLPTADAPMYAETCPPDCHKCVDACPTAALRGDYTLDRSRCITNWLWGAFAPAGLRHEQRDRMFGCGECLVACPRNAHVAPRDSYPTPVDTVGDCPELLPFVAADPAYYDTVMPTFPRQAGREAMRGNAIVALANSGDRAGDGELAAALRDGDGRIRAYAAWALGKRESSGARAALEAAKAVETDATVREEIEEALAR